MIDSLSSSDCERNAFLFGCYSTRRSEATGQLSACRSADALRYSTAACGEPGDFAHQGVPATRTEMLVEFPTRGEVAAERRGIKHSPAAARPPQPPTTY